MRVGVGVGKILDTGGAESSFATGVLTGGIERTVGLGRGFLRIGRRVGEGRVVTCGPSIETAVGAAEGRSSTRGTNVGTGVAWITISIPEEVGARSGVSRAGGGVGVARRSVTVGTIALGVEDGCGTGLVGERRAWGGAGGGADGVALDSFVSRAGVGVAALGSFVGTGVRVGFGSFVGAAVGVTFGAAGAAGGGGGAPPPLRAVSTLAAAASFPKS
jgi:hypothetical protein